MEPRRYRPAGPIVRAGVWVLLAGLVAAGCRSTPPGTPTLSSEEILATAQAIAELTRNAPTSTPSPVPATSTPTAIPVTSTPSATATLDFPAAVAKYNVSVRSGPGEEYPIVDLFLQGQTAQIIGRFDNTTIGTWWSVIRIGQGINGWVWSGATDVTGDTSRVPILEAPPTPEPGATS
ncbi:MAG TPA: SH3 domain-containing protein [Anaerolineales bacterium]|nr:SH3 domain-containing protein [Anaerolineales bacterium]